MVFFFFFQAEDGIRDLTVTGVQTCALPIWFSTTMGAPRMRDRGSAYWRPMMSTEPPGGNGTTSVIGREGYLSSARAASGASADRPARPRPAPSSLRRVGTEGFTDRFFMGISAIRGDQRWR